MPKWEENEAQWLWNTLKLFGQPGNYKYMNSRYFYTLPEQPKRPTSIAPFVQNSLGKCYFWGKIYF